MNLHELLLNDFNTATGFEMYATVLICIMLGFVLGIGFVCWMEKNEKTYKHGQIDAANGKMNYEKKENDNGELVWVEKNKHCTNTKK